MGHYYQPPPPIISATGAQPYAGNKLPPQLTAVRVDNPPFPWMMIPTWGQRGGLPQTTRYLSQGTVVTVAYTLEWLPNVIQSWQPPDPTPILLKQLSPGIPGQSVDFPPFVNEWVDQAQGQIVYSWLPPDPQPILGRNLSPGIPGQSVDNPIPNDDAAIAFRTVLDQWQLPPPASFISYTGWQPLAPNKLSPGIPGQSVDQPPLFRFDLRGVLQSWQPSDPQPQQEGKLSPGVPGQSIDNPPQFRPFYPFPVAPDPQPILAGKLSPGIPGQSVDNPPGIRFQQLYQIADVPYPQAQVLQVLPFIAASVQTAFTSVWLNPVLASWQPADLQPTLARNLNPSITAVRVDNPPVIGSAPEFWAIMASWQLPLPAPWQPAPRFLGGTTVTTKITYSYISSSYIQ